MTENHSGIVQQIEQVIAKMESCANTQCSWHDDHPSRSQIQEWAEALSAVLVSLQAPESVLSSPMAAGLLLTLKAECEAQHARAEKAETALAALSVGLVNATPVKADDVLLKDYAEARGYLERLFLKLAPQCRLQMSLAGVATQIDNYIAGLHQTIERLSAAPAAVNATPAETIFTEGWLASMRSAETEDAPDGPVEAFAEWVSRITSGSGPELAVLGAGVTADGPRFHWRDGWFFQRTADAVLVTLPDASQKVIPLNEWASIIASVSTAPAASVPASPEPKRERSAEDEAIGLKQAVRFAGILSEIRAALGKDKDTMTFDEIPAAVRGWLIFKREPSPASPEPERQRLIATLTRLAATQRNLPVPLTEDERTDLRAATQVLASVPATQPEPRKCPHDCRPCQIKEQLQDSLARIQAHTASPSAEREKEP